MEESVRGDRFGEATLKQLGIKTESEQWAESEKSRKPTLAELGVNTPAQPASAEKAAKPTLAELGITSAGAVQGFGPDGSKPAAAPILAPQPPKTPMQAFKDMERIQPAAPNSAPQTSKTPMQTWKDMEREANTQPVTPTFAPQTSKMPMQAFKDMEREATIRQWEYGKDSSPAPAPQPPKTPMETFKDMERAESVQQRDYGQQSGALNGRAGRDTMEKIETLVTAVLPDNFYEGAGDQTVHDWAKWLFFAKGYVAKTIDLYNEEMPFPAARMDPLEKIREGIRFYQTVGGLAQSLASGEITAKDLAVTLGENIKGGLVGDILYIKDNAHLFDPNAKLTKEQAEELGYRTLGAIYQLEKIGFTVYTLGRAIKDYVAYKTALLPKGAGHIATKPYAKSRPSYGKLKLMMFGTLK